MDQSTKVLTQINSGVYEIPIFVLLIETWIYTVDI